MAFTVIFKPLAQIEADEAYDWYQQDHIKMGATFLEQLGRNTGFLSSNPHLYPCVNKTCGVQTSTSSRTRFLCD